MNKGVIGTALAIVLGIILLVGVALVGTYNGLVNSKTEVETQQAQIETQLQRRFDLVPNLVEAVKGTMAQEREVFEAIANARKNYAGAEPKDKITAANEYESALGRLLVIMENYPTLQSNDTVKDLMVQLEGTENRVSVARQRYNESVQTYNTQLRRFPTNLLANMFGFEEATFFEAVEAANEAPKVDLSL